MSDGPEPTAADLHGQAIPAAYRRAPRTERFILTGVGVGAAVGAVVGAILPAGTAVGHGTGAILVGLAGALTGGLITGAQAAFLEYSSGRSVDRQREQILGQAASGAFPQVWSPDEAAPAGDDSGYEPAATEGGADAPR